MCTQIPIKRLHRFPFPDALSVEEVASLPSLSQRCDVWPPGPPLPPPSQVNDLLRRKEQSPLGDIGVTEVNKSVGAVWSCMDQVNQSAINR